MTSLPKGPRSAAIAASLTVAAVAVLTLALAPAAAAQEKAGAQGKTPDACAMEIGEGGSLSRLMMMEMGGKHRMREAHQRLQGMRQRLGAMGDGGPGHAGAMGPGKLLGGMVVDESVKKISRDTKEIVTLRRRADGGTVTIKRRIKKTKGGADITGTLATDDGKTATFKESYNQDKAGTIVTSREFTDFQGKSHSIKTTATKDGDTMRVKTEITRPDGKTVAFERAGDRDDREFNFHEMSRQGRDRSIKKSVERDDDGKVRKTTIVIATGDQDRQVTITRERSGDTATLTIERPDGTVHTFTQPCRADRNDQE